MRGDLDKRLAAARGRAQELSKRLTKETMADFLAAREDVLQPERDLAAAHREQYANVINIGPRWDIGAPLPHLVSNGSTALVICRASQPDPDWDGTYATLVSPGDTDQAWFIVIELRGCSDLRFGGPNDEAISGHRLHGKGLAGYQAHEVINSAWIEERIRENSVHPYHSDAPFRELHHFVLLFHDEMLEVLARGIKARPVRGTMRGILAESAASLIDEPFGD